MKRIFLLCFMLTAVFFDAYAAVYTWTWTGNAGDGVFTNSSNWSISPGADANTAAMGFPRNLSGNTSNIVFNGSATINTLPSSDFYVDRMDINSGTVDFNNNGFKILMGFNGTGLFIGSGGRLNINGTLGFTLSLESASNNSTISGTLDLAGTGSSANAPKLQRASTFVNPVLTVASGGKIILSGTNAQVTTTNSNVLKFQSGASFEVTREGGTIPGANYQSGSTIRIMKVGGSNRVTLPAFTTNSFTGDNTAIYGGDIEFDAGNSSSGQGGSPNQVSLNAYTNSFTGTIYMKSGYLKLLGAGLNGGVFGAFNVSGGTIEILPNSTNSTSTINGDLTISAGTFNVNTGTNTMTFNVNGQVVQSGGILDLATSSAIGIINLSGNLNQTNGTLTESGSSGTSTAAPRIVFKGTSLQTMNLSGTVSGDKLMITIDNNNNHVNLLSTVTLPYRIQCATGDLNLGANNLTVTDLALGSRSGGSIVTNGTGTLTLKNVGTGLNGKDFPVATSNSSHDAVFITNASGTSDFTVKVSTTINPVANLNTANALPRQWDITSTSAGANLEFDPDPSAGTQTNPKVINQYLSSAWTPSSAAAGVNQGYPYAADFTSFSSFVVGTTSAIPVELVSFSATAKDKSNLITWTTATERNVSHFLIERSTNGHTGWEKLTDTQAKGYSQGQINYSVSDETPLSISYYRLVTIDFDGTEQISKTVAVNRALKTLKINKVSPQPISDETMTLDFQSNGGDVQVLLNDMTGKQILSSKITTYAGQNIVSIPLSNMAKGVYFVTLNDGRTAITEKIIKQ
ncbi:MAG: T9SS type A sorting domain-containing protein [Saprospiraceae bacterium]|nr:T9SS type A sorting domain-containing protein [Saprospiraceae bacterium]